MKIAYFSDIHANREALSACVAHSRLMKADRQVFLGDFVGYGADPAWVVELIMEAVDRGALAVKGNHDAAMNLPIPENLQSEARESLEWTRRQLSGAHLAFLKDLPVQLSDGQFLYAHANPWAPEKWGYIQDAVAAEKSFSATEARIIFCGHVHRPCLYHVTSAGHASAFNPVPGEGIRLGPSRRWLVLPGSVGQPRDGNPAASYAIHDDEKHELYFFRIPYDHRGAAQKIMAQGLPSGLADRLLEGL